MAALPVVAQLVVAVWVAAAAGVELECRQQPPVASFAPRLVAAAA